MAVDTRNKRASVLGTALSITLVLPAPNSAIDVSDRQQLCWTYAGIASSATPPTAISRIVGLDVYASIPAGLDVYRTARAGLDDVR